MFELLVVLVFFFVMTGHDDDVIDNNDDNYNDNDENRNDDDESNDVDDVITLTIIMTMMTISSRRVRELLPDPSGQKPEAKPDGKLHHRPRWAGRSGSIPGPLRLQERASLRHHQGILSLNTLRTKSVELSYFPPTKYLVCQFLFS